MARTKQLIVLALAGTLAACGGGGGSDATGPALSGPSSVGGATVSAFVTDNLTTDYSEVWVTVLKVTAENSVSQVITVFEDPIGKVVNLATLANVGQLLNTVALPAGRYEHFTVTLADAVKLVNKNGAVSTATFSGNGVSATIRVDGGLTLVDGQVTSFALDFDLAQFTFDPSTNVVTPVVVYKDQDAVGRFDSSIAEIEGVIESVQQDGSFTLVPRGSSAGVTVSVGTGTLVLDDETHQVANQATALAAGARVEVDGTFDQSRLVLAARNISIETSSGSSSGSGGWVDVKGVVQSFDGSTLVLDVRDADFVPNSNTLSIANITNAAFYAGSLASLQSAGQWVELKGQWDGVTFSALVVELPASSISVVQTEAVQKNGSPS